MIGSLRVDRWPFLDESFLVYPILDPFVFGVCVRCWVLEWTQHTVF